MGYGRVESLALLVPIVMYSGFLFSLVVPTPCVGHCQDLTQKKTPVDALAIIHRDV